MRYDGDTPRFNIDLQQLLRYLDRGWWGPDEDMTIVIRKPKELVLRGEVGPYDDKLYFRRVYFGNPATHHPPPRFLRSARCDDENAHANTQETPMRFMTRALTERGDIIRWALDDIDAWHESSPEDKQPLHAWLGMSTREYKDFVEQGDSYLPQIVKERKAQARRVTPERITSLTTGQIFVFGSNEGGNHGRGAAETAVQWGARKSVPEGKAGQTYAIPTKSARLRTLCVRDISTYVNRLVDFADRHSLLDFLVTEVGCGLAGYKPEDIAPLFEGAIDMSNVYLPLRFWQVLWST